MVPVYVRVVLGNDGECDKVEPVACEYPEQRRLPRGDTHPPGTAGIEVFFGQRPLKGMIKYAVPGVSILSTSMSYRPAAIVL